MNKVAKQAKQLVPFTSLLVFFSLMVINARAQTAADNEAAAREISTAMNNSAEDWNKGNLDAFMSLYDASATMLSHCLFPDTGKRYENQRAKPLRENRRLLENTLEGNALNVA